MKKLAAIVIVMMSLIGCKAQPDGKWQAWSLTSHAKDSFSTYMKKIPTEEVEKAKDFIDLPAIMIPYQLGDSVFKEPHNEAGLVECQCAFDKDTLSVFIGDGFYSGAFFLVKVYKGSSASFFTAWSDAPDLRIGSGEWQEEIEIVADKFELALSKKAPFIIGETIYGIWKADYPAYQEKGDDDKIVNMKNKIKIYFSCIVEDEIQ
jgi:hypothetical protein